MSQRSAAGRRRSKRAAARPESRGRRIAVAIGTVTLVITPISWILLHEPQADQADAAVPYVTRTDDTYIKTSAKPAVATPPATTPAGTPTPVPTPGTPKPTETPSVPGETPTPTDGPTTDPTGGPTAPTEGPTSGPTQAPTTRSTPQDPRSQGTQPTPTPGDDTPSSTPTTTTTTTTPPPPPADDGNMSGAEVELFRLVDNARTDRGCAPLRRNSDLSGSAGAEARERAESGNVSATGSSMAATGGDGVTAKAAFDKLKSTSSGTLFNCGLRELGVGQDDADYCKTRLVLCLSTGTREAWVVDFK
jgi:uncharacterized protein YkwD